MSGNVGRSAYMRLNYISLALYLYALSTTSRSHRVVKSSDRSERCAHLLASGCQRVDYYNVTIIILVE